MADLGWIPLAERPEWDDVVPPPALGDGPPVVAVQYDARAGEVLRYFRALVQSGEKSKRALELTQMAIDVNPAHYTAWQYRWECLMALGEGVDLSSEMAYLDRLAAGHAKNYQLWNHRRKCVLALGEAQAREELRVTAEVMFVDPKNYHVWAHRQALVAAFRLWDEEMRFVEAMLHADVRNNSAWSQRAFVLRNSLAPSAVNDAAGASAADSGAAAGVAATAGRGGGRTQPGGGEEAGRQAGSESPVAAIVLGAGAGGWLPEERFVQETEFCAPLIRKVPHNEAGWAYLSGLLHARGWQAALADDPQGRVQDLCENVLDVQPSCAPALGMLAEVYHAQAGVAAQRGQHGAAREAAYCAGLVHAALATADPLRRGYWQLRGRLLECLVAAAATTAA